MITADSKLFIWLVTVVGLILLIFFLFAMGRRPSAFPTATPTPVDSLPTATPVAIIPVTPAERAAAQSIPTNGTDSDASTVQTSASELLSTITGVILDADGPVAGATVRNHLGTAVATSTADGTFTLTGLAPSELFTITAWADGYYINWTRVTAADLPIHLQLDPYYTTDNVKYDWFEENGIEGSAACGVCHTAYPEWQQDAHAQTATNVRFLSMYSGTDIHGNKSPLTGYTSDGKIAPPDLTQPYYGPGYKLDNPTRAGNCATCHAPKSAKIPTTDSCAWSGCHSATTAIYSDMIAEGAAPTYLYGDAAEGISCEFCHKIGDVVLNPETNAPFDDAPGIVSLVMHRPEAGEDLFFGPLDDVVRTDIETSRDSYLPLQTESEFCAACHYGMMGGVVGPRSMTGGVLVYSSYAEWLATPYSDPETGKSCQDCHMPATDNPYFVFPEQGGRVRSDYAVSNHQMTGVNDLAFMQSAVTMTSTATVIDDTLHVNVQLTNVNAGHHIPTDSPMRHLLLIVVARGADGELLPLDRGELLPEWVGDYAAVPGRYYAKLLRDKWSGEFPSGSYWREVELVEDTRLAALATDASEFAFALNRNAAVTVEVRLLYRRAFQQLMVWKAWPDEDLVLAERTLVINQP